MITVVDWQAKQPIENLLEESTVAHGGSGESGVDALCRCLMDLVHIYVYSMRGTDMEG